MTFLALLLSGEVPEAPIFMALALVVAFLGSVGIGVFVVRHTPDAFAGSSEEPGSAVENAARHAA